MHEKLLRATCAAVSLSSGNSTDRTRGSCKQIQIFSWHPWPTSSLAPNVFTYTYTYTYAYAYTYIHIHIYIHIYIYCCACIYIYIRIGIRIGICICICAVACCLALRFLSPLPFHGMPFLETSILRILRLLSDTFLSCPRYFTALHWSLTQFTPASMEVSPSERAVGHFRSFPGFGFRA